MYNNSLDKDDLIDIKTIKINTDLPINERIEDFINQIKNPYHYKCGKIIVKINFLDTEKSLEDKIEEYISSL